MAGMQFVQGMLTEAAAERAAAQAREEAAAVSLDHATMAAQEQELATLREALAFEEALRQQARHPDDQSLHAVLTNEVPTSRASSINSARRLTCVADFEGTLCQFMTQSKVLI